MRGTAGPLWNPFGYELRELGYARRVMFYLVARTSEHSRDSVIDRYPASYPLGHLHWLNTGIRTSVLDDNF